MFFNQSPNSNVSLQILKVCAESQLDDPVAKYSAMTALFAYVKDGTVVKDADGIDLLEWATKDLLEEDEFAETLGPLRVRAAKASPKDQSQTTRCLESCLLHWDLVSAQQVCSLNFGKIKKKILNLTD